jgi:transcriptional regulator with XRE-family HTH domain
MKFGDKLRAIRLQKGITQESIAQKLGYKTNSYISAVENNKFVPPEDKLKIWAKAIDTPWENIQQMLMEIEFKALGITDPGFQMMLKDVPNMSFDEKREILDAYHSVLIGRAKKLKDPNDNK